MENGTTRTDWTEMRRHIRQAVLSLEVCWKCQKVSECVKYVLGHTVLVWLCQGCVNEMESSPERPKSRGKAVVRKLPEAWRTSD